MRAESLEIVEGGWDGQENESDYFHDVLPDTGEDVFHRVQYVFPKARRGSFVTLLGQPFILKIVQRLLGDDFLCAAEACKSKKVFCESLICSRCQNRGLFFGLKQGFCL